MASVLLVFPMVVQGDSIILSPADFNQNEDDNDYFFDTGSLYVRVGCTHRYFSAPIHLPQNAAVTSVVVFYMDNDINGNVQVNFYKKNAYTEALTPMASYTSSGASPSYQNHKIAPIVGGNRIDNGGYTYNCRVYFTNANADENVQLCYVKILYRTS